MDRSDDMSRISFSDNEESKGRVVKVQVVDRDTIEVAIKLFPELKVLRELYHRIRAIEARRMELLLEETPTEEYNDEMECQLELTDILENDLRVFQLRRVIDANKIKASIRDAEATIDDIEEGFKLARLEAEADMIKKGIMLPAVSKAMDWEADTNVGDTVTKDEQLDAVVTATVNEIAELRERLNYHAVLHGLVQKWKLDFAEKAELRGNELAKFLEFSEKDQEMRLSRLVLPEASKVLNEYLWKEVEAARRGQGKTTSKTHKNEMEGEGSVENDGNNKSSRSWGSASIQDFFLNTENDFVSQATSTKEEAAMADWSTSYKLPCFTCGETDHVTKDCRKPDFPSEIAVKYERLIDVDDKLKPPSKLWEEKDIYCENCGMMGHPREYCNLLYPEEEKPNFCEACKKHGHMEDRCWMLHPELKVIFLREQKERMKKMKCNECGELGHIRRWCHKLHPKK